MFTTILIVILGLLGLGLLGLSRTVRERPRSDWNDGSSPAILRRRLTVAGICVLLLDLGILFLATFTLVGATEVGVPKSFGSVGQAMAPGVHFVAPWTDVETYPTRPLSVDVKAKVRTADAGQVTVATTARWKVSVANARELFFQVRTGDEDVISEQVVSRNLSQATGDVYNTISNVDSTKRAGRAEAIEARLQQLVAQYGIDITALQLREVEPDPTTAGSIATFAAQQRKTAIAVEANKTAEKEAIRRKTEATGIKNAAHELGKVSPTEAYLLCVQEWANATNADKEVYSNPCTAGGVAITKSVK